jgi:hypothetical protein
MQKRSHNEIDSVSPETSKKQKTPPIRAKHAPLPSVGLNNSSGIPFSNPERLNLAPLRNIPPVSRTVDEDKSLSTSILSTQESSLPTGGDGKGVTGRVFVGNNSEPSELNSFAELNEELVQLEKKRNELVQKISKLPKPKAKTIQKYGIVGAPALEVSKDVERLPIAPVKKKPPVEKKAPYIGSVLSRSLEVIPVKDGGIKNKVKFEDMFNELSISQCQFGTKVSISYGKMPENAVTCFSSGISAKLSVGLKIPADLCLKVCCSTQEIPLSRTRYDSSDTQSHLEFPFIKDQSSTWKCKFHMRGKSGWTRREGYKFATATVTAYEPGTHNLISVFILPPFHLVTRVNRLGDSEIPGENTQKTASPK